MAVELSPELVELGTRAWEEIRAGRLTVDTAEAVHAAVAAHAEQTGQDRLAVEMALKRAVRHPES
ncbi:hypothetical protein [Streptomyces sp. NPDC059015]|uniref:hypothetical protein n=1 Tax=unclassified Streptomyces TaxID=2593676 RepID=UPI00368A4646